MGYFENSCYLGRYHGVNSIRAGLCHKDITLKPDPTNSSPTRLDANSVSLCYGDGDNTAFAVNDVSICLNKPGFYGVIGPSGSGKSSLLYLLSGLKRPTSGEIVYRDRMISAISERERAEIRRKHFGFVFQQPFLLNFLTARENVLLAATPNDSDASRHLNTLLEELHIDHLAKRFPAHLSGGERQRLAVARAMINRPDIIFADEPTAALDHANGWSVINLLKLYRNRGMVIVVTHDHTMLEGADRIYTMLDGKLDGVQELNDSASNPQL